MLGEGEGGEPAHLASPLAASEGGAGSVHTQQQQQPVEQPSEEQQGSLPLQHQRQLQLEQKAQPTGAGDAMETEAAAGFVEGHAAAAVGGGVEVMEDAEEVLPQAEGARSGEEAGAGDGGVGSMGGGEWWREASQVGVWLCRGWFCFGLAAPNR